MEQASNKQKKNYQFFKFSNNKKKQNPLGKIFGEAERTPLFSSPHTLAALASELGLGRAEVGLTGLSFLPHKSFNTHRHIASHPSNLQESSSNHPIIQSLLTTLDWSSDDV